MEKKPFSKKRLFLLIVIIAVFAILIGMSTDTDTNNTSTSSNVATTNNTKEEKEVEQKEEKPSASIEELNALAKAKVYSDTMYMSKAKIYDQLTSDYGEGFDKKSAQYAIDNLEADYKYNALQKDMDVIASYAKRLGYVAEGEKLIKISGLAPYFEPIFDYGFVLKSKPVVYIPEWICKSCGFVFFILFDNFKIICYN